jgi:aspartyl-tRNA(Asn)/glutamyl-tRNA(Gln) amidotransferase subunit A
VSLPHIDVTGATVSAIMLPEALAYHRPWLRQRRHDYGRDVRLRLQMGALYQAVDYLDAQRTRSLVVEAWTALLRQIDLLVTPATPIVATRIQDSDLDVTMSLARFTNPFNLTGLPAISLPCGFTKAGLPIGLHLAGRPWDEATVLRAAYCYEQAAEWHKAMPPVQA